MGFAEKEQSRGKKKSVVSMIAGIDTDERIEGQESIETLEKEQKINTEKKKAGRPKKPETAKKKRVSFTITPNIYEKALKKSQDEGKSLSELVTNFLTDYLNK